MIVYGSYHDNEPRDRPPVRLTRLTIDAQTTHEEKALALLARLVAEGGELAIEIKGFEGYQHVYYFGSSGYEQEENEA